MFNDALKNVENARKNYGVPDEFRFMNRIEGKDIGNTPFDIVKCIQKVYQLYDKEAEEFRTNSEGKPLLGYVTFIQIADDTFIALKSTPLKEQLENITGEHFNTVGFYEVPISGVKVKLGTTKVKYADKKEYDNWVLVDDNESNN